MTHPIISPTRDNDIAILQGVLAGVEREGSRYGLTQRRRRGLALLLDTYLESLHGEWEEEFFDAVRVVLFAHFTRTGRPSQPESSDGDHSLDLPAPVPERTR